MLLVPLLNVAAAAANRKWTGISLVLLVTISITTTGGSLQHSEDGNPNYVGAEGRRGPVYSHGLTTGTPKWPLSKSERQGQRDPIEIRKETFRAHLPGDSLTQERTETYDAVMKDRKDVPPHISIGMEDLTSGTSPQPSSKQYHIGRSQTLEQVSTSNALKERDKTTSEETYFSVTRNGHRRRVKRPDNFMTPKSVIGSEISTSQSSSETPSTDNLETTTVESAYSSVPGTFQGTSDDSRRTPESRQIDVTDSGGSVTFQQNTSSVANPMDNTTESRFTESSDDRNASNETENDLSRDAKIVSSQSPPEQYRSTQRVLLNDSADSDRHSSLMAQHSPGYRQHLSSGAPDVTLLNGTNESSDEVTLADMDWSVNRSLTTVITAPSFGSRRPKDYSNPGNDYVAYVTSVPTDSAPQETNSSQSFAATTDRTQTSDGDNNGTAYGVNDTSTTSTNDDTGISAQWEIPSATPDMGVSSVVTSSSSPSPSPSSLSSSSSPSGTTQSSPIRNRQSLTSQKYNSSSRPSPTASPVRLTTSQTPSRPGPPSLVPDRPLSLRWPISPRRIVIPEGEIVDIIWECPPSSGQASVLPEKYHYDWYKVSSDERLYRDPLSSSIDPINRKSILRMQGASTAQEGRYFCTGRGVSLFNASSTQMGIHVYQLVVLRSRWVNIGSVGTVTLYRGQRAVINCPFGDIVRNNITVNRGRLCSGRMSVSESLVNRFGTQRDAGWQHFRCTDSDKVTVKTPPEDSSSNCSMSLLGCAINGHLSRPRRAVSDSELDSFLRDPQGLLHLDKCHFKGVPVPKAAAQSRADGPCSQNGTLVFLRYYFDTSKGKCFPVESRSCGEDPDSFSTLRDCQQTCVSISAELKRCFLPTNRDQLRECTIRSQRGLYRLSYNLETNSCKWFYHCGPIGHLSANVFNSIRQCNEACVRNRPRINAESIKACNYADEGTNQPPVGYNASVTLQNRWIFNRLEQRCQLRRFLADGSIGNGRFQFHFSSRKSCESTCRVFGSQEICKSRPDNGMCSKKRLRWLFNWKDGKCIQILDGGCGNSLNRFHSRQTCERICSRFIQSAPTKQTVKTSVPTSSTLRLTSTHAYVATRRVLMSSSAKASGKGSLEKSMKSRRRVHRRIPDHMLRPQQVEQRKTPKSRRNIAASKPHSKLLDRRLDFDPCLKDAIKGTCDYGFGRTTYRMKRYTFNVQTGRCQIVPFSGCLAGQNLFDDANDCKAACEYRLRASLKSQRCQNPYTETCVTPDQAQKAERLLRYFFFSVTGECIRFSSVDSRQCLGQFFQSQEHCLKVCSPRPPMERMLQNRCFGKYVLSDSSCPTEHKVDLWFFFSDINQCLQYTTCPVDIDGNVFLTRVECEQSCRATNIMTVCELPVDAGKGTQNTARYYHDSQQNRCRLFYYKGSFGNLNRFATKKECTRACPRGHSRASLRLPALQLTSPSTSKDSLFQNPHTEEAWLNEMADTEYCYDQHRYGACSSTDQPVFVKKYYYDAYRKQCEPYMFSGCGALSRNSFDSIVTCDRMCTERISRTTSSLCSQKVSRCADSSWIYWIYNAERGLCEPFPSCIRKSDDQFFFTSEKNCSDVCAPPLPLKRDHFDICHLTTTYETNCSEPSRRWSYDRVSDSCQASVSCDRYGNNFPSMTACLAACHASSLIDVCRLPVDKGPCQNNSTVSMFYFDWSSQTCKPFAYGGCIGNRNRFQSYTECNMMCSVHNQCNPATHNIGNCEVVKKTTSRSFFYNTTSNKCQIWTESVCGDPAQLFSTLPDCVTRCVFFNELKSLTYRDKRKHHFRCFGTLKFNSYPLCVGEWLPRFFYNHDLDQCMFFYYNGCQGTEDMGNRFSSMDQCTEHCGRETSTVRETVSKTQTTPAPVSTDILQISGANVVVKHELCPSFSHPCLDLKESFVKCHTDSDCRWSEKCCSCEMDQSIVSSCMEPIGCIATEYGCCQDGITVASDELHNTCPSQLVQIDSSLPESIKMESAEDLILNCYVAGDPRPNITWVYHGTTKKSFPVDSKWDLIRPLWSGSLRVSAFDKSYGLWSCQATNKAGWDEKELYVHDTELQEGFLEIYDPDGRESVTINATRFSNVTIHCPIYGIPRPTITWSFNKDSIDNGSLLLVSVYHRMISIVNVDSPHEGVWSCQARNTKMKSVSFKTHLRVVNTPRMVAPRMGTDIKAWLGQTIILFCNVPTGLTESKPRVNWFWEARNRSLAIRSGLRNDSKILIVPNFQVGYNSGSYVCRSSDGVSEQEVKHTIVPYTSNEISIDPAGMLFVSMTVTLRCPAGLMEGVPSVVNRDTIWTKGHVFYRETKTNELELTLKSKRESGLYSCKYDYDGGGDKVFSTYLLVNDNVLTI